MTILLFSFFPEKAKNTILLTYVREIQLRATRYGPAVVNLEDLPYRLGRGVDVVPLVHRQGLDHDVVSVADVGDAVGERSSPIYGYAKRSFCGYRRHIENA